MVEIFPAYLFANIIFSSSKVLVFVSFCSNIKTRPEEFQEFVTYSGVFVHRQGQFIAYFLRMAEIGQSKKRPKYGKYCCAGALNYTFNMAFVELQYGAGSQNHENTMRPKIHF